jgi:hypothetical protein
VSSTTDAIQAACSLAGLAISALALREARLQRVGGRVPKIDPQPAAPPGQPSYTEAGTPSARLPPRDPSGGSFKVAPPSHGQAVSPWLTQPWWAILLGVCYALGLVLIIRSEIAQVIFSAVLLVIVGSVTLVVRSRKPSVPLIATYVLSALVGASTASLVFTLPAALL